MMEMIVDILVWILGLTLSGFGLWFCWDSSVYLTERSHLRKITGAYYDFDIDKALKEMGKTRAEALKEMK
tara:strand:- start:804 stop:1013 length:210 start_codon:yes stop_codon:yes gene_type:complete